MKRLLLLPLIFLSATIFSQVTETFYIIDGNDDAFEVYGEAPLFDLHYLKLGMESYPEPHITMIGLRFQNFTVPKGSEIVSAYLQFSSFSGSIGDTVVMWIYAELSNNAEPFKNEIYDIHHRARTSYETDVEWTTQNWQPMEPGPDQKTPDLKALIQEIIDFDGWSSGNAIHIRLTPFDINRPDSLTACSYEYANEWYAPQLIVEYIEWSDIEDFDQTYRYSIYPNPTTDQFNVSLNLNTNEYCTISLFDFTGTERNRLYDGILKSGRIDFKYSATDIGLVPGVYFLSIKSKNSSSSQKLIIK